ncbi:hypothetical protein QGX15_gp183 [Pseudomonas phage psageK4e]|uniref:Uncharacterized protein n=1 Tax=Pseudomonas phage psageK4e TaxID=2875723 RepID=A0AAE8XL91_9CAUD|nr:hypothetical protein QGX15_gp183 [Pseudomonas phage psageK4e]UAW53512.1 hypothetical protein psageK4e_064 [Pseudomonas phage psageK4e]
MGTATIDRTYRALVCYTKPTGVLTLRRQRVISVSHEL